MSEVKRTKLFEMFKVGKKVKPPKVIWSSGPPVSVWDLIEQEKEKVSEKIVLDKNSKKRDKKLKRKKKVEIYITGNAIKKMVKFFNG